MSVKKSQLRAKWSYRKEAFAIALLQGIPLFPGKILRRLVYRYILAGLGKSVEIQPGVEFEFANRISIGNKVLLYRDVRIRCRGIDGKIQIKDNVVLDRGVDIKAHRYADIDIGEGTYIGPYTCLSGETIKIGKKCLIASHSGIYANNHNFADPTQWIQEQGANYKGITIEDDCWLGCGVRVVDGVTIGQGSVIGAGAVVTKSIPPYSIAVGVPAKVIGQRDGKPKKSEKEELSQVTELLAPAASVGTFNGHYSHVDSSCFSVE